MTNQGLLNGVVTISGATNPSDNGVYAIGLYVLFSSGPLDLETDLIGQPNLIDINVFPPGFLGLGPTGGLTGVFEFFAETTSGEGLQLVSANFGPPPNTCHLAQLRHIAEQESSCMEAK